MTNTLFHLVDFIMLTYFFLYPFQTMAPSPPPISWTALLGDEDREAFWRSFKGWNTSVLHSEVFHQAVWCINARFLHVAQFDIT